MLDDLRQSQAVAGSRRQSQAVAGSRRQSQAVAGGRRLPYGYMETRIKYEYLFCLNLEGKQLRWLNFAWKECIEFCFEPEKHDLKRMILDPPEIVQIIRLEYYLAWYTNTFIAII